MSLNLETGRLIVAELREEFGALVFLDERGRVKIKPPKPLGAFFLARIAEHLEDIKAALREESQRSEGAPL